MNVKAYLLSLLATAFPNLLGFLAFPLYAKLLGAEDYGMVALLEAYQGMFSMLLCCGMSTAFYVFYSHAKDVNEQKSIIAASVHFSLFILAFVIFVALTSSHIASIFFQNLEAPSFVAIYAFAIFSDYLLTVANAYLRVEGRIAALAGNAIMISIFHHGVSFYTIVISQGDVGCFIMVFFATKAIAVIIAGGHLLRTKSLAIFQRPKWDLLQKMIRFGAPLVLTSLTGWILLLSDRLFINYYVSTADVGVYAVGYKFAMGLWIGIVQPFMTVWEPTLFKVFLNNAEQGYAALKRDFTRYLAIIVVLYSAFILFIDEVLKMLFANTEYSGEEGIIYLLAASYFLMAVGEMCASVCRLNKTSKYAFWVTIAVISTKIVFNVAFIPTYLLIGAAAASVIAEFVAQLVMINFAVRLSRPRNLFFSMQNGLLLLLFFLAELFLYLYPGQSLFFKSQLFALLLLTVAYMLRAECTQLLVVLMKKLQRQQPSIGK